MKNYLEPINGINRQKSFYKRAFIHYCNGETFLQSYNTIVAMIDKYGRKYKLWNGYSKTTLEHVKAFFEENISKKEWDEMPIYNPQTGEIKPTDIETQYKVVMSSGFAEHRKTARFANSEECEDYVNRLNRGLWCAWTE